MNNLVDYKQNVDGKAEIDYQQDYIGKYNKRTFVYTVKGRHIGKEMKFRVIGCRMEWVEEVWDLLFDDILYDDLGCSVEDPYLLDSYMDEMLQDITDWFNVNGGDLD